MHIVWVNDHADFTGGCEHYIAKTVGLLKQKGFTSTLLYSVGCPVNPTYTSCFDSAFPIVESHRQLEEIKPDLIYIHRLESLAVLEDFAASRFTTVRFFHDHKTFCLREHKYTALTHQTCSKKVGISCYSCLGFFNKKENGIRIKWLSELEHEININKKLDYFVVGSNYMAGHLKLHEFPADKIITAPLFTDNKLQPNNNQSKSNTDHIELLFVGQLVRGKGLDTLIEALSKLNLSYHLTVCGTGKMATDYKRAVIELGISDKVTFTGQQSKEKLSGHYQNTDVVVIPARAPETFCLVGIEALNHGKPVIATNVGGMSDWLKPNFNGLAVNPNDSDQLAEAIERFAKDKALYKEITLNIQTDDYSKFSKEHHISLLNSTFTKLTEAS